MIKNRLTWKIGGPAGAGIMVTGLEFSRMCARGGLHIFDYAEYPLIILIHISGSRKEFINLKMRGMTLLTGMQHIRRHWNREIEYL